MLELVDFCYAVTHFYLYNVCALTDDGVLFYVSLALSCVPNAIFSPPCARPSVPIIFRWSPAFAGCLDPKPRHPPVGGSAVVASPRLDGSRLPAQIVSAVPHPAGWPFCCFYSLLLVVLRVLPSRVSNFHTDCAGNPLQPTSTWNSHTLHPLSLQSAMRCAYFSLFFSCATSQFSSHCTVSSMATNVFDCWDTSTASGLKLVSTMLLFSCLDLLTTCMALPLWFIWVWLCQRGPRDQTITCTYALNVWTKKKTETRSN